MPTWELSFRGVLASSQARRATAPCRRLQACLGLLARVRSASVQALRDAAQQKRPPMMMMNTAPVIRPTEIISDRINADVAVIIAENPAPSKKEIRRRGRTSTRHLNAGALSFHLERREYSILIFALAASAVPCQPGRRCTSRFPSDAPLPRSSAPFGDRNRLVKPSAAGSVGSAFHYRTNLVRAGGHSVSDTAHPRV